MTATRDSFRAAYADDLASGGWAATTQRLASTRRGTRCAAHGRRCHGGPRQAHHWARRFYQTDVAALPTWMLVGLCRSSHLLIHRLSWLLTGGRSRVRYLPVLTLLVVADGKLLQLLGWWVAEAAAALTGRRRR